MKRILISFACIFAACDPVPPTQLTRDVVRLSPLNDAGLVSAQDASEAGADIIEQSPDANGGSPDAGVASSDAADTGPCTDFDLESPRPADRTRTVLVAHTNGSEAGSVGTTLRRLLFSPGDDFTDMGATDVGISVEALAFTPSSSLAFAVAEDGALISLDPETLNVLDTLALPGFGHQELHVSPDGKTLYVVSRNSNEDAGIDVVSIACDGSLTLGSHFGIRLASSLAILPDGRGVLLGGQAVFEPIDDDDVRLLNLGQTPNEIDSFDIYTDFIDALKIDVSPSGEHLAIPNGSPFSSEGAQVIVAEINGDNITLQTRISEMNDARSAYFAQSSNTLVITRFQPGVLSALTLDNGQWIVSDEATGLGLVSHIAPIKRGLQTDTVLISSVLTEPQIVVAQVGVPLTIKGVFELGAGIENIPSAIAISP